MINNKWHDQLLKILNEMNDDIQHNKLSIYRHSGDHNDAILISDNHDQISDNSYYTFQINKDHSWCSNTNAFDAHKTNEYGFCSDIIEYFMIKLKLSILMEYQDTDFPDNLGDAIKYYYNHKQVIKR